jgi:tRNA A-37 threonylcarbamoyl transferase component Bud32
MSTSDTPDRVIGGRYRLERTIGTGGMGTVWAGQDELLGRTVAVKEVRFPAELSRQEQDSLRERTLREARATARLSHPNVVTTYDVVEEDDRPWIVMELVPSRSLSQVLEEDGPLPPRRVAEIGLAVLGALEASHRQGVVHRDVKPGNVLITEDGRAVLTDFGIASVAGDPSLTSTGMVMGSPAYMSPERARGQSPGAEADLWSLGATLYAAVEGRPPYDRENPLGTLTAVISEPVDPPTVEGPLHDAILGLLAKEPAERLSIADTRRLLQRATADPAAGSVAATVPASAAALHRAGRTEALQPAGDAGPAPDPDARRQRMLIGGLVVFLLILLGALAFALAGDDEPTPAASDPTRSETTSAPETSEPEPTTEEPTESATTQEAGSDLPGGYTLYEDPRGFSVGVPDGWERSTEGTRVDFTAPGGSQFIRFDSTTDPKDDPEKDWKEQEKSVKDDLENYEKIDIDTVEYRDYPAADWEFTFGEQTHVLNRGFVAGTRGYAIYVSSPESQWDESRGVFDVATDTFQPAD